LRYFVAGHFWLFVGMVLFVGKKGERYSPEYDSFAGYGWMEPSTYNLVILASLAVAAACFVLARRAGSERWGRVRPLEGRGSMR